ncbi:MAG: MotA/TolQ/ExbB proton channel family protein [Deltaproteobacteria bacterium]|nr:MAG: MotA/TolQ/ExbB proton channel family protein [Deltaproteobacteria bacterium]
MNEVLEVLTSGGSVMVVTKLIILAGSIAAVIIGIERALFLRGFAAKARELHEQVVRALLRGDAAIALHECDRSHVATAALYRAAFDRAQRPDRVADAVDRARREVIQALRAPLWVLGTLGAVMPFVGLFGTVVGILGSFRQIGATGQSGFAVVAPAISEALITTAGGIAVAVEAVVLFNIFQARIAKEAFDMTLRSDELTEVVIDHAADVSAALQAPRSAPSSQPAAAGAVAQGHA